MKKTMWMAWLFLLVLPAFALAETWTDFVARADAAMAGGDAQVVLETRGTVEACGINWEYYDGTVEPLDPPLTVPEGVRLTLRGGDFEGMVLGNGDFLLEDVTVTSRQAGQAAILLDDPNARVDLRLELGTGTLVRARGGLGGIAIGTARHDKNRDKESFPVRVHIVNHGRVEAPFGDRAIMLSYRNDGIDGIDLRMENTGSIDADLLLYAYSHGDAVVSLHNLECGSIAGVTPRNTIGAVSRLGMASAELVNGPDACIEDASTIGFAEADSAILTISTNGYADAEPTQKGSVTIRNDGVIRGHNGLMVLTQASENSRLDYSDAGRGEAANTWLRLALIQFYQDEHGQAPEQQAFQEGALAWLGAQQLPDLPPDTPVVIEGEWHLMMGRGEWLMLADEEWSEMSLVEDQGYRWAELAGE